VATDFWLLAIGYWPYSFATLRLRDMFFKTDDYDIIFLGNPKVKKY
jgi:hypothetical protein